MDVKEIDILGEDIGRHWYYRAKAAALLRSLPSRNIEEILDVGAGSGFFSKFLLSKTAARRAVCVDTSYTADRDECMGGKSVAYRRSIQRHDADVILLMDVLEHVADESELLAPYVLAAAPGAHFVVSVPAFPFLWSGHDVFLEHYRRYTRKSLLETVKSSGLEPVASYYFFAGVFPAAAATRLWQRVGRPASVRPRSQLRKMGPWMNAVLHGLCSLELPVMKYNRMFGLSLFAVFRKP